MPAEITERKVPQYVARCEECDVFLGSLFRRNQGDYLQSHVDRHNLYCHSDELLAHKVARTDPMLIGYSVECVCGATSKSDTTDLTGWRCRLDRTEPANA